MNKRHIVGVVAAAALITAAGGAGATAADLLTGKDIQDDSIASRDITDGSVKVKDLTEEALAKIAGEKGDTGAKGDTGPKGDKGDSGVLGAYYAVAFYNAGNTNSGSIATVACKATTDVAISGGVQVMGIDDGANARNTPVSSSFPGRMNWSTYAPLPDRLDGWIVQFGGTVGQNPLKTKIWALCVPGASIPVEQTYVEVS